MKKKFIAVIVLIIIVVGVYIAVSGEKNTTKDNVNERVNIKELVQDYSSADLQDESASITSQQLIITKQDESKETFDLPEDEFFVSIAPYINETHPCATHSLTGCQGEMVAQEFDVYIEDKTGNIILDKSMKSQANGFIDFWLPRNNTYKITISQDGKAAESEFSTFEKDDTCISTMQLKNNENS